MDSTFKLKRKAALISLFIGLGMLAAKTGAYLLTGSSAIFSDAAESIVHVLATSMALFSIYLSAKPEDDSHLYGHGNIEYFSAGIEGLLIIIAAFYIIYESIQAIITGPELKQLDIGVLIITAAGTVNLFLGFYLIRMGKKTNSLTLIADGKHVLTDSYTSIGVIVGIILVLITDFKILDPLFAIAVALNILFTGSKLMRDSIGGLMNENNPELMKEIAGRLAAIKKDFWIDIHELRFWRSGDRIFVDFHLICPFYFTIQHSHQEENRISDSLKESFPNAQLKIHFDYCRPELCKYCGYSECIHRSEIKSNSFIWNEEKMKGKPIYEFKVS